MRAVELGTGGVTNGRDLRFAFSQIQDKAPKQQYQSLVLYSIWGNL